MAAPVVQNMFLTAPPNKMKMSFVEVGACGLSCAFFFVDTSGQCEVVV
jgi:hypothetical protein